MASGKFYKILFLFFVISNSVLVRSFADNSIVNNDSLTLEQSNPKIHFSVSSDKNKERRLIINYKNNQENNQSLNILSTTNKAESFKKLKNIFNTNSSVVIAKDSDLSNIASDSNVASIVEDTPIYLLDNNSNALDISNDSQSNVLNAAEYSYATGTVVTKANVLHSIGITGDGVKIAIFDTGINYLHKDLKDNYAGGYDFVNDDNDPFDDNGHGTHVAGVIAGELNDTGMVGESPKAKIYALKIMDANGNGYASDLVSAINWAVANGVQITNASLGFGYSSSSNDLTVYNAYLNAVNAGIINVAAVGNSGTLAGNDNNVEYPAKYPFMVAVSASDFDGSRAVFKNAQGAIIGYPSDGPETDVSAPGNNILSTWIPSSVQGSWSTSTYAYDSGTSMATPFVTGALADLVSMGATSTQAISLLYSTSLNNSSSSDTLGYGMIQLDSAAKKMFSSYVSATSTFSNVSTSSLSISWSPVNYATSYKIIGDNNFPTTTIATSTNFSTSSNLYTLNLDNLSASTTYNFKIYAENDILSATSSSVSLATSTLVWTLPASPTNIKVTSVSTSSIILSWRNNSLGINPPVTYYKIFSSPDLSIATTSSSSLLISGLSTSTLYTFSLKAYNSLGGSDFSATTSTTTLSGITPPVFSGSFSFSNISTNSLTLNFPNIVSDNSMLSSLKLYQIVNNSTTSIDIATSSTYYSLSNLSSGTTYNYFLIATNIFGTTTSPISQSVTTSQPQVTYSSGGGGGGGGGGVAYSYTSTNFSIVTSSTTNSTTSIKSSTSSPQIINNINSTISTSTATSTFEYTFDKDLKYGNTNIAVKWLQIFLNKNGFLVSKSGSGSLGKETNYFGNATKLALKKYQEAHADAILSPIGLTSGTGILGSATRNYINNNSGKTVKILNQ